MNQYLIWGGVVVLALLGVVLYPFSRPDAVPPAPNPISTTPAPAPAPVYVPPDNGKIEPVQPLSKQADFIIDITTVGFSPDNITIKKGDSIIWTNRDRADHQVATASGNNYPDNGPTVATNSCGVLRLGQSCKVTFTAAGTWSYYDKLDSKFTGSVIVQ